MNANYIAVQHGKTSGGGFTKRVSEILTNWVEDERPMEGSNYVFNCMIGEMWGTLDANLRHFVEVVMMQLEDVDPLV